MGGARWLEGVNAKVVSRLVGNLKKSVAKAGAPSSRDSGTVAPGAPKRPSPHDYPPDRRRITMVGASLSDEVVLQAIDGARCQVDVTQDALVSMKQAKTSDAIISAMIRAMK